MQNHGAAITNSEVVAMWSHATAITNSEGMAVRNHAAAINNSAGVAIRTMPQLWTTTFWLECERVRAKVSYKDAVLYKSNGKSKQKKSSLRKAIFHTDFWIFKFFIVTNRGCHPTASKEITARSCLEISIAIHETCYFRCCFGFQVFADAYLSWKYD